MAMRYIWTDGRNRDFAAFSDRLEDYLNSLAGGEENRRFFIPHNTPDDIHDVVLAYDDETPVGCAGFKEYDRSAVEIKRVWVEPSHRGRRISEEMLKKLEARAADRGYRRMILQTRPACKEAVSLYETRGYERTENYPPYTDMDSAVCYKKELGR